MDPRIEQIERTQIYGLFDQGVLIYIGQTKMPLEIRLEKHRAEVRADPPIYQYLDSQVDDLRQDLEIHPLSYGTEQEALNDLENSVLNTADSHGSRKLSYNWTSEEIDHLEELIPERSITYTSEKLGISRHHARNAALKLGLTEISSWVDWKKWDDKLGTMTDQELADLIGCGRTAVRNRRVELEISPHGRIDWEKLDQYLGEISDVELAEKIGCTPPNVKRRREKLDISPHSPRQSLTDEEIITIRVRYAEQPNSYRSLADEFDVGSTTIGSIIRGKTHQDLPMPEDLTEEEKEDLLELSHN